VILNLYEKFGESFVDLLDGQFSFVLADAKNNRFMAARDHMGKTSMYVGYGSDGSIWFASEMKALTVSECERVEEFPPGSWFSSVTNNFQRWYNPPWWDEHIPDGKLDLKVLREAFEQAVVKRLMTDGKLQKR
jgi:asparagine synthase (glutamine-hydrolysing)